MMAWTLLAHCGGSPGVTTTALGLTLTWPTDVVLVDADPHPMQSVLAGYLQGLPAGGRGLAALAQQYRSNPTSRADLAERLVTLDAQRQHCQFLPGFNHLGQARLFEPFWEQLATDLATLKADVVIDCGRLGPDGPPKPLTQKARQLLFILQPTLSQIAVTRSFLAELRAEPEAIQTPIGLVIIGSSAIYSAKEISRNLSVPVVAELTGDLQVATMLSDGGPAPKKLENRGLWRDYTELSSRLAAGGQAGEARRPRVNQVGIMARFAAQGAAA